MTNTWEIERSQKRERNQNLLKSIADSLGIEWKFEPLEDDYEANRCYFKSEAVEIFAYIETYGVNPKIDFSLCFEKSEAYTNDIRHSFASAVITDPKRIAQRILKEIPVCLEKMATFKKRHDEINTALVARNCVSVQLADALGVETSVNRENEILIKTSDVKDVEGLYISEFKPDYRGTSVRVHLDVNVSMALKIAKLIRKEQGI